jgi:quinol monooxygenase YgiN
LHNYAPPEEYVDFTGYSRTRAGPRISGKDYAVIEDMVLMMIRMKTPSDKRMELSQTIISLIGYIRTEKGCKRCDFYQQIGNENELCLMEQWDCREDLRKHLESRRFGVLKGAMSLLKEPYEMTVNDGPASGSGDTDA